MRTLVHLSDIHFGRVDETILPPLIAQIHEIHPDVVAVSGDLTQRARGREFLEARAFLRALPQPQIVVPGNHDVPLHNVYARFRRALEGYRQYITEDLEPFYADPEIAIAGSNTARSLTWKGGRISQGQVSRVAERMCSLGPDVTKILVTHHPFDLPENYKARSLVGRAAMAMERLLSCGVDLLLAGHLHLSHTGHTALRYKIGGHSAIFVQAGTLSMRGRGEANAFNVVRIEDRVIEVRRMSWRPESGAFMEASREKFERSPEGWARTGQPAAT
jgi:3',5'-cyclic AMP phosphodiesterase CpdA